MSWRMKNILGLVLVAVVLVIAGWLPTRFLGETNAGTAAVRPPTTAEPEATEAPAPLDRELTREEKAELFQLYKRDLDMNVSLGGGYGYRLSDETGRPEETFKMIDNKIAMLSEGFVFDDSVSDAGDYSTGTEFFTLTSEQGGSITVCRYFLSWQGDWKNWFTVFIDVDTGEIYHFYVSSGMDRYDPNRELYYGLLPSGFTAEQIGELWGNFCGISFIDATWDGNPDSAMLCKYSYDHDIITYNIWIKSIDALLFDYKVTMVS